jgi:hypothetical protein
MAYSIGEIPTLCVETKAPICIVYQSRTSWFLGLIIVEIRYNLGVEALHQRNQKEICIKSTTHL